MYKPVPVHYKIFIVLMVILIGPLASASDVVSPLFGIGQDDFEFGLSDIGGRKHDVKYQPNMVGISRVALTAYGFTVGSSFRGSDKDLDPNYGKTEFFDAQLDYHNRQWGIDAVYQVYKGFYTKDMASLQVFPELKFQQYSLMGRYALEESDFSVGALMNQSDEIKKTSGKYYLVGGFRQHIMDNPISLLQQDYVGVNADLETLRKMKVTSVNFGVGAGKYWVSDSHWFFGALFDVIGTYGFYKYTDAVGSEDMATKPSLSYNLKVGFGYAGEVWKIGMSAVTDSTTLVTPGSSYLTPQALRTMLYLRLTFK